MSTWIHDDDRIPRWLFTIRGKEYFVYGHNEPAAYYKLSNQIGLYELEGQGYEVGGEKLLGTYAGYYDKSRNLVISNLSFYMQDGRAAPGA